jgi:hypothetical protein
MNTSEALQWLNVVEQALGGATGPTIKLRAAIVALGEPVSAEICSLPVVASEGVNDFVRMARCVRCVTPAKCGVHGCCPNTWPAEAALPDVGAADGSKDSDRW